MSKRIMAISIGIAGLTLSFLQAHPVEFYMRQVHALAGLQTEAREITRSPEVSAATITPDSVRERTVFYADSYQSSSRHKSNQAAKYLQVWATAYTSHPFETDSTPFVTASGSTVRDGIVAANFLPMGTKFKVPDLYGDKVFIVEDRMNSRYNNSKAVDIWFESRPEALEFGRKTVVIELL